MLRFAKYHGCGNDFILITEDDILRYDDGEDALAQKARSECPRPTGIGADGLIVVRRNPHEMAIYNSDGSRAPMCGNGIRCFAHYCFDEEVVSPALREYDVQTLAGAMKVHIDQTNPFVVTIGMGRPDFSSRKVGIDEMVIGGTADAPTDLFRQRNLDAGAKMVTVSSVFIGTIHTVVWVSARDGLFLPKTDASGEAGLWRRTKTGGFEVTDALMLLGKKISEHPVFSEKTNVNFAHVLDSGTVEMITYERGAGLTAACGTGACAVAVTGAAEGKLERTIRANLPFGSLGVTIDEKETVYLTGPSIRTARGQYYDI
jgi:diaminopimelate epimerase